MREVPTEHSPASASMRMASPPRPRRLPGALRAEQLDLIWSNIRTVLAAAAGRRPYTIEPAQVLIFGGPAAVAAETELVLAGKFAVLFPHLDERQRRLLMAAEARALGFGGIRAVARAAGVAENTVARGVSDLDAGGSPLGRTRRPGGGRKRLVELHPELRAALLALVEPDERGDPMSPLRWTTKSTRQLAEELGPVGRSVVRRDKPAWRRRWKSSTPKE